MLRCDVLCCVLWCCFVVCCVVLCCVVLYCVVLRGVGVCCVVFRFFHVIAFILLLLSCVAPCVLMRCDVL